VPASAGQKELDRDTADGLKALIDVALEISNLKEFLGREKPTVITVRRSPTLIADQIIETQRSKFHLPNMIPRAPHSRVWIYAPIASSRLVCQICGFHCGQAECARHLLKVNTSFSGQSALAESTYRER
jgi:hypothetical protein